MRFPPRPYQRDAVDRLKASLPSNPILVAPTGSGKSFMLSLAIHELELSTIWLTHRKELVEQAVDELAGFDIRAGVIMAGKAHYHTRPVQVASVDTLRRRPWVRAPELIIIDEAHHGVSKQFRSVLDRWPAVPRIGATATPFRLDNRGLGDVFGAIVEAPREQDLVDAGFLVEPRAYAPPPPSVAGVNVTDRGDYNATKLARVVDKPKLVGDVVQTWLQHAVDGAGLPGCFLTIGFACSIEHSRHLVQAFNAAGVTAEHVDADTPREERAAILDRFRAGVTRVLWNVGLFTEGFNVPAVECIVVARPTASLALHKQILGRATRVHPGKRYPIVLDHAGNLHRHGRIVRPLHYSLEGAVTAAAASTGLRTCPRCYRMCAAGRAACPECGFDFTTAPRELPESVEGVLVEYEDPEVAAEKARADERDAAWWKLVHTARTRRFRPGWVAYEFHRRYGEWRDVRPVAHIVAAPEREPTTVEEMLDFAGGVG